NEAEEETIKGMFSKLDMYVVRLALILELICWACGESKKEEVSVRTMEGAIKLIEYFRQSAIRIHSVLSNSDPLERYPKNKQDVYMALPETFSTEAGLKIAKSMGMSERTYKRFLKESDLFHHLSRGEYEKRV
ncbi:MAG TPA: DUF3987 domain-containing protein, partial [Prolixibacteraceae bacterium]|nr:DUF3987 domain-containing protein [Prolixibacteraceae bacterium]